MILDTSALIDVLRGEERVRPWEKQLDQEGIAAVTTISVMELWEGIHRSTASETEREKVEGLLTGLTEHPFDTASAMQAGEIAANLSSEGNRIEAEDIMIAAIALERGETILTGNPEHFERISELEVESY